MKLFAWAVLALAAAPLAAAAHTRSVSYSSWTLAPGGARVELRVSLLELSRLGIDPARDVGSDGPVARYLAEHLTLARGGVPCTVSGERVSKPAPQGQVRVQWPVACTASGAATIESRVLLAEAPSHLHFARVATPGGALERVLSEAEPSWSLPDAEGAQATAPEGSGLADYVRLGVVHILSGWDHLAFVLALLLLASRFAEVAGLVTAFTLAHSITLALAVLGVVRPEGAAVEALIGYSIALVAAENAWLLAGRGIAVPAVAVAGLCALALLAALGTGVVPAAALLGLALFSACHFGLLGRVDRPARLRAAVAFAFGLIHGFGFAGVLAEMELPAGRVAPALFGFNLGVELGQLAIVALIWPPLQWLEAHLPGRHRQVAEAASAAICGLGLYWFVARTFA